MPGIIVHCVACGGDGGWDYVIGHGPHGPIWRWQECMRCEGRGEISVEGAPLTLDDLDEMGGEDA